ncbi:MAG: sulfite exporter TauE/SafE family protein [Candidatus Peribacter sp.]|jgi:sulfite exporter TauE/SafE/copper chaperone CopZ
MTTHESSPSLHLRIAGMHCASCELLLERKLKSLPGVRSVRVNHRKGTATLWLNTAVPPARSDIERLLAGSEYRLVSFGTETVDATAVSHREQDISSHRHFLEIGGALVIIFAIYKLLQTFDIVSLAPSTAGALTFGGVFVIGLVAGSSSCLAVTGGLLLAMAAKYHEMHPSDSSAQKIKPLLHFNAGRLLSYFVLGGVVGVIGQSITLSPQITGYMNIIIALVMISLALTILKILPKGFLGIRPPKAMSHWIADLAENKHPAAPFALGAFTFFLPCGFTQSLQLVALASGSFASGALVMGVFALGTLPSLLGLSFISSNARGSASRLFLTFSGTLVLLLALFNLRSGLALAGFNVDMSFAPSPQTQQLGNDTPTPYALPPTPSVQDVTMAVTGYGYEPSEITIRSGIPVRFHVDGTNAGGCTRGFVIPSLGIQKVLAAGDNVFEFTPESPGRIPFSCSMGMVRGSFTVI